MSRFTPYVNFFNDQATNAVLLENIASSNLDWETTTQTDIGLEIGFLNNKYSLSLFDPTPPLSKAATYIMYFIYVGSLASGVIFFYCRTLFIQITVMLVLLIGIDLITSLFIERVVGYATCDVAPSSFTDQVVIKLKTAAKKNNGSFHRETCIRHLFTLGIGENDSDMVIERCEELLEKYKNQQGNDSGENKIVTEADLVLSMESLLKVTKKLLEK